MNRLHRLVTLTLLLAALFLLQYAAAPLPAVHSVPLAAPLARQRAEATPAPASVRDFTVYAQVGWTALDPRAEVLFDN